MQYLSVSETAKKWSISKRSVRNYCANGRIEGAYQASKTWYIPENASNQNDQIKRKQNHLHY